MQQLHTVTVSDAGCPGFTAETVVNVNNCCSPEAGNTTVSSSNICPGTNITATAPGFNNAYNQTYILVNSSGTILQISSTGTFTAPSPCGIYTVYSYNYQAILLP
ncbi:MAG: hypothetical protein IPG48_05165 [Saprospiraceae bacterium]|nr:hypothetical protein [Saprospiraceae bacterium]